MLISEVYQSLLDFITEVLGFDQSKVIPENDNAPAPLKPFVTVQVGNLKNVNFPNRWKIDAEGVQDLVLNKTFIVTINSYADRLHEAEDMLNTINNYFRADLAYYHFKGEMAYIRTIMGVTTIPREFGAKMESRAVMEAQFNLTQVIKDGGGLIKTVEVTYNTDD